MFSKPIDPSEQLPRIHGPVTDGRIAYALDGLRRRRRGHLNEAILLLEAIQDENEELRAEQDDDRRAWGRDSVAWELAVEGLKEENARLRGLLVRAERVIMKRYLDTGGIHVDLLDDIRRALGLPGELTQEDRNLAVRPLVID